MWPPHFLYASNTAVVGWGYHLCIFCTYVKYVRNCLEFIEEMLTIAVPVGINSPIDAITMFLSWLLYSEIQLVHLAVCFTHNHNVTDSCCIVDIPYSEHSSVTELEMFVRHFLPKRVIPTVGVGDPKRRECMTNLINTWMKPQ